MSQEQVINDSLRSSENLYIDFILEYLNEKKRSNPYYSLRALARDLEISPSTLSEAINRRHCLSLKTGMKIAEGIKLGPKEKEQFETLLKSEIQTKKRI